MNNRLKLYNDSIYTYLSHKDKIRFRKIAFSNKMTMSEFNRRLIQMVIKMYENKKIESQIELIEDDLSDIINSLGGVISHKQFK